MLLEVVSHYFRAGLIPGCIRFSEVKRRAVFNQTKKHHKMQILSSCRICTEVVGKVNIRKVVVVGYLSNFPSFC